MLLTLELIAKSTSRRLARTPLIHLAFVSKYIVTRNANYCDRISLRPFFCSVFYFNLWGKFFCDRRLRNCNSRSLHWNVCFKWWRARCLVLIKSRDSQLFRKICVILVTINTQMAAIFWAGLSTAVFYWFHSFRWGVGYGARVGVWVNWKKM